jgi:hypothetical protein
MKLFCTLALVAASALTAANPQLKEVNTVYILSMGGGMDQFLANSLTTLGVFQVVTDPQRADAILTDRLGETFETKLNEIYPPPPEAKPAPKETKDGDMNFGTGVARIGSFNRGKGNYFVVDRKTRLVLWSTYERPKDSSPGELSKSADRVVKHLKNDLK